MPSRAVKGVGGWPGAVKILKDTVGHQGIVVVICDRQGGGHGEEVGTVVDEKRGTAKKRLGDGRQEGGRIAAGAGGELRLEPGDEGRAVLRRVQGAVVVVDRWIGD